MANVRTRYLPRIHQPRRLRDRLEPCRIGVRGLLYIGTNWIAALGQFIIGEPRRIRLAQRGTHHVSGLRRTHLCLRRGHIKNRNRVRSHFQCEGAGLPIRRAVHRKVGGLVRFR